MADPHVFAELVVSPPGGTPATFQNVDELKAWAEAEAIFWRRIPGPGEVTARTVNPAISLASLVEQYRSTRTEGAFESLRNALKAYDAGQSYHSSSPLGQLVAALRSEQTGEDQVHGALTYLLSPRNVALSGHANVAGVIKAVLYERGLGDALTVERKALEALGEAHTGVLKGQRESFEQLAREFAKAREDATTAAATTLTEQTTRFEATIADATKARETTDQELKELAEYFRKKVSFHAGATYWGRRRVRHMVLAWFFGVGAAALAYCGIEFLYTLADELFGRSPTAGALPPMPPTWQIAALVIMLSVLLWAIRILVRLALAHAHQNLDAGERVVMLETYLALAKEGHVTEKQDRRIILASLFRHSPSGLVKDDAAPATPYDFLSRWIAGK